MACEPVIFGFLLAICFDPTIWTGATQPRWALLAVGLPILLAVSSPNHFSFAKLLGALFIAWAALSLTWAANLWDGLGALAQLTLISLAALYGSRLTSLEATFKGLALGITISSLILIIPPLHSLPSIVLVYPHGLFGNRNMLGEVAALTALGLMAYKSYWFIPGLLPAIFWQPVARDAILALAVGILALIWQRSKTIAFTVAAFGFLAMIALLTDPTRIGSLNERIEVWSMVWNGSDWLGHGIGSLYTLAPYLSGAWDTTISRIDHAHNDALEIFFELGLVGFALYAGIIACALQNTQTLPVLLGFLVISSVAFPWHIPANAFIGALVVGHAVRDGKSLRALYDDWRASILSRDEACTVCGGFNSPHAHGGAAQSV